MQPLNYIVCAIGCGWIGVELMKVFTEELDYFEEKRQDFTNAEKLFELPITMYPQLLKAQKDIKNLESIFHIYVEQKVRLWFTLLRLLFCCCLVGFFCFCLFVCLFFSRATEREREGERERDRDRDRQTDRQTDRDRERDRQTDRQKQRRHTETETVRDRNRQTKELKDKRI